MRYKAGLETRDKILEATRGLIAEAGLEGTTIKAICDRAGVLPGSFYNLFASKEEAILSVVRDAIDAVDPDPSHEGPDDIDALVNAYVRFLDEQGDVARVYIRIAVAGSTNGNGEIQGRILRHHEGRVKRFSGALRSRHPGLSAAEADRRAETMVSALNGIALHRVIDPRFDVQRHADAVLADLGGRA